ncbi:integrase core domain-containing protein, partial [Escherichia coli]|uniref:integrase core domain-containing protein n=1 Tax=Escherichia coli TaxID=562 RepID=UPI00203319B4
ALTFQNHTDCPLTDFGGKTSIFSHPVYLFLRKFSLQDSRGGSRDYISIMPKPDGLTAAKNLAEAFEHYNEWHPHSALGYRSPREYLRQRACNGLSDNRCLEI